MEGLCLVSYVDGTAYEEVFDLALGKEYELGIINQYDKKYLGSTYENTVCIVQNVGNNNVWVTLNDEVVEHATFAPPKPSDFAWTKTLSRRFKIKDTSFLIERVSETRSRLSLKSKDGVEQYGWNSDTILCLASKCDKPLKEEIKNRRDNYGGAKTDFTIDHELPPIMIEKVNLKSEKYRILQWEADYIYYECPKHTFSLTEGSRIRLNDGLLIQVSKSKLCQTIGQV